MDFQLTNEQIAHDLAVVLCAKSFPSENFPSNDTDINSFVQEYFAIYDRVLKSVKCEH